MDTLFGIVALGTLLLIVFIKMAFWASIFSKKKFDILESSPKSLWRLLVAIIAVVGLLILTKQ